MLLNSATNDVDQSPHHRKEEGLQEKQQKDAWYSLLFGNKHQVVKQEQVAILRLYPLKYNVQRSVKCADFIG